MAEAWVIEAVRTPFGRRGGSLAGYHPIDLLALALDAVVARAGVAAGEVTAVVAGCGAQVGAQAGNIARRAVLAAGWPESIPGITVESHAASSAEAVISAYQSTLVDPDALVVACGVDVMSTVPLGANLAVPSVGKPFGRGLADRYPPGTGYLTPGQAAEEAAERWSLGRSDLDRWALLSGERARKARGRRDLVPVALKGVRAPLRADEGLSPARTARQVRSLAPLFEVDGLMTAANMAAEADGAAAVLVAGQARARRLGLGPKARLVSAATTAVAPSAWPEASVGAAMLALDRAGCGLDLVERCEVHESSAAAVLAWARAMGVAEDRVNPEGGALAWGAPVGAAGAALFVDVVAGLSAGRQRSALVAVAADGGLGAACLLRGAGRQP